MLKGFGGFGEVGNIVIAHRFVQHGDLSGDIVTGAV